MISVGWYENFAVDELDPAEPRVLWAKTLVELFLPNLLISLSLYFFYFFPQKGLTFYQKKLIMKI